MKVGIITFHGADNYGAVLQAWALTKWLKNHAVQPEILDYRATAVYRHYNVFRTFRYQTHPYSFIADLLKSGKVNKRRRNFEHFRKAYLPITNRIFHSSEELAVVNDSYDSFICGSDQIWNPKITDGIDPTFFLNFVSDNNKKIAYAPSVATEKLSNEQIALIVSHISGFRKLSIREQKTIDILQPYCLKKIHQVNDPVFLLQSSDYDEIEKSIFQKLPYVFLYVVGSASENRVIIEYAELIAKKRNLKLIYLCDGGSLFVRIRGKNAFGCKPEKFLSYIKNAQFVISNSFHATVFSIIFQIQFVTFLKSTTDSRLKNLLTYMGLENRIYSGPESLKLIDSPIEFPQVAEKLETIRKNSEDYLSQALLEKEKNSDVPEAEAAKRKTAYQELCKQVDSHKGKYYIGKHRNDEIRSKSRSGGIFTAISDIILEKGGVVYGCKMDGLSRAIHARATTKEERDAFRGSKYIQSEMGDCFSKVKEDLRAGKLVLFSGTGCQIAGLKSYLKGIDQSSLYTVDIVCHGVPSVKIWKAYLVWIEKKYSGRVKSIDFRDKKYGWSTHFETFIVSGRKRVSAIFRNLFYQHYILRPSCYSCPFSNLKRVSDITLGDAWGIERSASKLNDNKGCSLILLNSEKGRALFKSAEESMIVESVEIDNYLQPNLKQPSSRPTDRDEFWNLFNEKGFSAVVKKYGKQDRMSRIKDGFSIMASAFSDNSGVEQRIWK